MAVCPHCRAGPSRAGFPEELARVPSVAPATRAVVTGAEGARVGGGAATPLVRGSGRGRAAGVVPSRTTGRASPIWVIALAGSRALGRAWLVPVRLPRAVQKLCGGGWRSWARQL